MLQIITGPGFSEVHFLPIECANYELGELGKFKRHTKEKEMI